MRALRAAPSYRTHVAFQMPLFHRLPCREIRRDETRRQHHRWRRQYSRSARRSGAIQGACPLCVHALAHPRSGPRSVRARAGAARRRTPAALWAPPWWLPWLLSSCVGHADFYHNEPPPDPGDSSKMVSPVVLTTSKPESQNTVSSLARAVSRGGEFNYHVRGHPLLIRPFAKTKPPHPAPVLRGCSGNRVQIF